jgi:hypothetical protein
LTLSLMLVPLLARSHRAVVIVRRVAGDMHVQPLDGGAQDG